MRSRESRKKLMDIILRRGNYWQLLRSASHNSHTVRLNIRRTEMLLHPCRWSERRSIKLPTRISFRMLNELFISQVVRVKFQKFQWKYINMRKGKKKYIKVNRRGEK